MVDFATRACLMSTEALRFREMYRESAVELIKLTNEVRRKKIHIFSFSVKNL